MGLDQVPNYEEHDYTCDDHAAVENVLVGRASPLDHSHQRVRQTQRVGYIENLALYVLQRVVLDAYAVQDTLAVIDHSVEFFFINKNVNLLAVLFL